MARRKKRKPRSRPAPKPATDPESGRGGNTRGGGKDGGPLPDSVPPAPWGSFPLMQLAVFAGLVLIVIGVVSSNPTQLLIGLGLGSLGGLELSLREHLAGYRSHTTLLAGVCFVLSTGITYFALQLVLWVCLLVGAAVFGLALWYFRDRFQRATDGLSYRLR